MGATILTQGKSLCTPYLVVGSESLEVMISYQSMELSIETFGL
jgi:hypothetical protein